MTETKITKNNARASFFLSVRSFNMPDKYDGMRIIDIKVWFERQKKKKIDAVKAIAELSNHEKPIRIAQGVI